MSSVHIAILCMAYILGLLSTHGTPLGGWGLLLLGVWAAIALPRFWRFGPKPGFWLMAGVVGFLASIYITIRVPQPTDLDISRFLTAPQQAATVSGRVVTTPQLTRSGKARFWLEVEHLGDRATGQTAEGKLYITIPLLQATGLHPGSQVEVEGKLYEPQAPTNPGGFDFREYLAKEGAFAGLAGREVHSLDPENNSGWGWWRVRQRIVRAQVRWMGVPEGPLMSSMVLGRRAVDLPYDIRDLFVEAGLAHVLAASGFHVSLILGVVLALTKRYPERTQGITGVIVLVIYVGLTGASPSVLRAAVMGLAGLAAMVMDRKVNSKGALLLAATLLLLVNPLWVWDLGFQMSFLATLGLLVTSPALTDRLDWMPPTVASLIAVPLAASLWVLPLQLYNFGVVPSYSVVTNAVLSFPITGITLGGALSAFVAIALPIAGSALAWLLYYPVHWLIQFVTLMNSLPGNTASVGIVSELQVVLLYGLILWIWFHLWWHKRRRWVLGLLMGIALVAVPASASRYAYTATLLADSHEPVLVMRDRGKVLLINSGDAQTIQFALLPFLRQKGIQHIDLGIDTGDRTDDPAWLALQQEVTLGELHALDSASTNGQEALPQNLSTSIGSVQLQTWQGIPAMQAIAQGKTWLVLGQLSPEEQQQLAKDPTVSPVSVLCWSGEAIAPELLDTLKPKTVVAPSFLDPEVEKLLSDRNIQFYQTTVDGALTWMPENGLQPLTEVADGLDRLDS